MTGGLALGADEDSSALGADEDSVFLLFAKRHSDCGSSGGKAKSAAVATGRSPGQGHFTNIGRTTEATWK